MGGHRVDCTRRAPPPDAVARASPAGARTLTGIGDSGGGSPETTPGTPSSDRHWWRSITGVTRSFDFTFSEPDTAGRPTRAQVVVHKHFTGTLHVAWMETVTSSTGS